MHPPTITTISSKSSFTYKQNARILFDNETSQDIERAPVPKPSYIPYNIPHDYRRWGWSSPTTSARWSSSLSNANLRRLSSSWRLPNPSHGRLGVAWESKNLNPKWRRHDDNLVRPNHSLETLKRQQRAPKVPWLLHQDPCTLRSCGEMEYIPHIWHSHPLQVVDPPNPTKRAKIPNRDRL